MRNSFASSLVALALLAAAATSLSACNTARGFGEDMSAAGHAITGSADKVQNGE
jgi:entericidin B